MDDPSTVWNLLNSGGVIATLILAVHLFVTGKVVPSDAIRRIVRETVKAVLDELEGR